MKVRVKGLVFVGFAAAVFAQNAMATDNPDAKTVTSKLYVDQKIETTTGTGGQNDPYVSTISSSNANADTKAPSIRNVYEFVMDKVGDVDVIGDNTYTKAGVVESGDDAGKFKVELKQTPMLSGDDLNGTLTNDSGSGSNVTPGTKKALVTAQAVQDLLLKETTAGTTSISQSYAENVDGRGEKHVPTVRNVYDYSQPKALNSSTYAGKFQVGYRASGSSAATWKVLQEDDTANVTHYVKMAQKDTTGENANVYNVNLDSNTIASSNSDFVASTDTNAATKRPKLATAGTVYDYAEAKGNKATAIITSGNDANHESAIAYPTTQAVYDFVTTYAGDTYQPKVASNESSAPTSTTMYIGKYVPANGATPASETWDRFVTDGYVTTDTTTAGTYKIKLDGNKIAATSDITSATSSNTSGEKLATAWSVKGLLDDAAESSGVYTTSISSSSLNTVYPSSRNVYEYVKSQTGGNVIPAPGEDCSLGANGITDSNNHACALVLAYWAAGESPTGTAGVGLKWVPMPQP